jgi:nucleoside-diphosphate-sugar epimerase
MPELATTPTPVLVTGATGFIGASVVRRLNAAQHDVHVLLRPGADTWRIADLASSVTVHEVDLTDTATVALAVRQIQPRVVLHLATYGAYEHQDQARRIIETNVIGTQGLLEASLAAGVRLFINTGSSSEYGYSSQAMSETDRIEPNSLYAVAKAAQTELCRLVASTSDMASVSFRLFSVYGPWEEPGRLFPTLICRTLKDLPLEMVAPDTARDFVFVDDVIEALVNFPKLEKLKGEVINLGSGTEYTLKEVVEVVQRICGHTSAVHWGAMTRRRWDSNRWQADVSKAKELLNWSATTTLDQGVAQMSEWIQTVGTDYALTPSGPTP